MSDNWGLEICHYCGNRYHPMPRWTPKEPRFGMKSLIYVCSHRWDNEQDKLIPTSCSEKAEADGYEYRRDLTPTR